MYTIPVLQKKINSVFRKFETETLALYHGHFKANQRYDDINYIFWRFPLILFFTILYLVSSPLFDYKNCRIIIFSVSCKTCLKRFAIKDNIRFLLKPFRIF